MLVYENNELNAITIWMWP